MTRTTFLGVILLLSVVSIPLIAQPKIHVDKTKIDLGTIYHGDVRSVKLLVGNSGDRPLQIRSIETSCGCTSVKKILQPIAPGSSDTIEVSFNSTGFDGKIRKEVLIYSDDTSAPTVFVSITGTVFSELVTVPKVPMIQFGSSPIGTAAASPIVVKNVSRDTIVITGVSVADKSVTFTVEQSVVAPAGTTIIIVHYTPRSTALVDQTLQIQTNSPRQPRVPFRFMYAGRAVQ
jgi:hypothetical protein